MLEEVDVGTIEELDKIDELGNADRLVVDTVLEELDDTGKLVGVLVGVLVRVLVTVLVEVMVLVLLDSAELEEDEDIEGERLELDC